MGVVAYNSRSHCRGVLCFVSSSSLFRQGVNGAMNASEVGLLRLLGWLSSSSSFGKGANVSAQGDDEFGCNYKVG